MTVNDRADTAASLAFRWTNLRRDLLCQIDHLAVPVQLERPALTPDEWAEWTELAERFSETMNARVDALLTDTALHLRA